MNRPDGSEEQHVWEKVWRMFVYVHDHLTNRAENNWFIVADDTYHVGFPVMDNIRWYTKYFNSHKPWYFGHTMLH
eukprot:UN24053